MTIEKKDQMNELTKEIIRTAKLKEFKKVSAMQTKLSYLLTGSNPADVNAPDESGQKGGAFIKVVQAMGFFKIKKSPKP